MDLVKKEEMDICCIDICRITNSYLDYLKKTGDPDLERTGNFIRLASALLLIKSRTLLPSMKEEEAEEESADKLKDNLVRLLKEYQKYQIAGKNNLQPSSCRKGYLDDFSDSCFRDSSCEGGNRH